MQAQTYVRPISNNMQMDELKMINPDVVKKFNLGNIDQLMFQDQGQPYQAISVGQPLLG